MLCISIPIDYTIWEINKYIQFTRVSNTKRIVYAHYLN